MELLQGIEAEARLRVLQPTARLNGEPEVAEGVGKFAAFAARHRFESLPLAYDEGSRVLLVGLEQRGNVLGEVLTVGI